MMDNGNKYTLSRDILIDRIHELEAELARINKVAACGTVDSFLKLSDDDKRKWFVMAIEESERRKKAEEELAALRQQQGEPVAEVVDGNLGTRLVWLYPDLRVPAGTKLYREASPKQQGEPVAWMLKTGHGTAIQEKKPDCEIDYWEPLYREAAPKQQGEPVAVVSDESDYDFRQYLKCAEHLPFGTKLYREAAPRVPEGWKLVPIEPTLEMVMVGEDTWVKQLDVRLDGSTRRYEWPSEQGAELCARVAYRAMLAAAPEPKE